MGDRDAAEELSQLLVVPDGQQQVLRNDAVLLVVPRRVPCQLQHLKQKKKATVSEGESNQTINLGDGIGGEGGSGCLGGEVDGGACTDVQGVVAQLEVAPNTAGLELEASLHRPGDWLLRPRRRLSGRRPPSSPCRRSSSRPTTETCRFCKINK